MELMCGDISGHSMVQTLSLKAVTKRICSYNRWQGVHSKLEGITYPTESRPLLHYELGELT